MYQKLSILIAIAVLGGCGADKTTAPPSQESPVNDSIPASATAPKTKADEPAAPKPASPSQTATNKTPKTGSPGKKVAPKVQAAGAQDPTKTPTTTTNSKATEAVLADDNKPTLTLVHAANLQGEIEPCG